MQFAQFLSDRDQNSLRASKPSWDPFQKNYDSVNYGLVIMAEF